MDFGSMKKIVNIFYKGIYAELNYWRKKTQILILSKNLFYQKTKIKIT